MRTKRIAKCVYCGKEYISTNIRQIYCSKECTRKYYWENREKETLTITCKYCGVEFQSDRKKMYCSISCAKKASNVRRGVTKVQHTKVCPVCSKEFKTVYTLKIYCSDRCYGTFRDRKSGHIAWEEFVDSKHKARIERLERIAADKKARMEKRSCVICGKEFECIDTSPQKTCSTECSIENKKRRARIKADKRISKEQIIDKDINLDALIKRDNNRCYICGCECDKTDIRTSKKGNPYPGKKYPTIEHLIPICRGGKHAWDNVRLACWECNLKKGTDIADEVKLDKEFAYQYKKKPRGKKVVQMTKDGRVVRIWESASQAAKENGWKGKHIGSVCNGNMKSAYGYIWKHAE